MAKTKGIVSKDEQKLRDEYQTYLKGKKWGTKTMSAKEGHKSAETYYNWKKKKTAKAPNYSSLARRQSAEAKSYKDATGRNLRD